MSTKHLVGISYLEAQDFTSDGSLKPYVGKGKPVLVFCQGAFCGYCTQAKPAVQKLANSNSKIKVATIQIDGSPPEKKASENISKHDPTYRGVPCYLGFNSQGRFVKVHNGGRDFEALNAFANSL